MTEFPQNCESLVFGDGDAGEPDAKNNKLGGEGGYRGCKPY